METDFTLDSGALYRLNISVTHLNTFDPVRQKQAVLNTHLLGAAHDLLECLRALRDSTAVLNHLDVKHQVWIDEVIAKATGSYHA